MMTPAQPNDHQATITMNSPRTNLWRPETQLAPRGHHSARHKKQQQFEQFKPIGT